MAKRILIYGSYGYTGKLIVAECIRRGLSPMLAGRNVHALKEQAENAQLSYLAFPLEGAENVAQMLKKAGCDTVLHCAGPFIHTAETMAEACLQTGVHYLDITGEFEVIEQMARKNERAQNAGIVMMPGVGFDVVPSDCLARFTYEQLQSTELLRLHILFKGSFSAGSAATALEHFAKGSASRKNGIITSEKPGSKTSKVYFGSRLYKTTRIQWGDISSAFHSTGISNIEVFMALPPTARIGLKASILLRPLLKLGFVRRLLHLIIKKRKSGGPDATARAGGETRILAEAFSINREYVSILLTAPEAYMLTAQTATEAAIRVMGDEVEAGFQTPSRAFGADFILGFEGVNRKIMVKKGL